jgi:cytochrome c556
MRLTACFGLASAGILMIVLASACSEEVNDALAANNRSSPVSNETNVPGQEAAEPVPVAEDVPPAEEETWRLWITQSPTKQAMQRMWINCGLITGNGPDVYGADFDVVADASSYIARRAGEFAGHWRVLRDENKAAASAASSANWRDSLNAIDRAHAECGTCHDEYWPPAARGFLPETLRRWRDDQSVLKGAPWGEQVFQAPPEVGDLMRSMQAHMTDVYAGISSRDQQGVKSATLELHKLVSFQLSVWDEIERNARIMIEASEQRDREKIRLHYTRMTNQCQACHAAYARDRALNPLPWPDMDD